MPDHNSQEKGKGSSRLPCWAAVDSGAMVPQSDASSQNIPSGNTAQAQRCRQCDAQHW